EVGDQSPGRERAATCSRDERWRSRKRGSPLPASPIFDGGGEVSEPRSEERGAETCSRDERWRSRKRGSPHPTRSLRSLVDLSPGERWEIRTQRCTGGQAASGAQREEVGWVARVKMTRGTRRTGREEETRVGASHTHEAPEKRDVEEGAPSRPPPSSMGEGKYQSRVRKNAARRPVRATSVGEEGDG